MAQTGPAKADTRVAQLLAAADIEGVTPRRAERWRREQLTPAPNAPDELAHLTLLCELTGRGRDNDIAALELASRGFACQRLPAALSRLANPPRRLAARRTNETHDQQAGRIVQTRTTKSPGLALPTEIAEQFQPPELAETTTNLDPVERATWTYLVGRWAALAEPTQGDDRGASQHETPDEQARRQALIRRQNKAKARATGTFMSAMTDVVAVAHGEAPDDPESTSAVLGGPAEALAAVPFQSLWAEGIDALVGRLPLETLVGVVATASAILDDPNIPLPIALPASTSDVHRARLQAMIAVALASAITNPLFQEHVLRSAPSA